MDSELQAGWHMTQQGSGMTFPSLFPELVVLAHALQQHPYSRPSLAKFYGDLCRRERAIFVWRSGIISRRSAFRRRWLASSPRMRQPNIPDSNRSADSANFFSRPMVRLGFLEMLHTVPDHDRAPSFPRLHDH